MKNTEIVKILNDKKIVIMPSDTTWGIFGILNPKVKIKINTIKSSPKAKKLQVTFSNKADAKKYLTYSSYIKLKIFKMENNTLILRTNKDFNKSIGMMIGVRITSSTDLEKIIGKTGPLYSTSANKSGSEVCSSYSKVKKAFPKTDIVKSNFESGTPSKIYRWDKKIERIR